jgi:hypothetical protein
LNRFMENYEKTGIKLKKVVELKK